MKKILAIGLILLSHSAWAEWTEVFTNVSGDNFYIDLSTLKTGQRPRIWVFGRFAEISAGIGSAKQFVEADCAEGRLRTLSWLFFRDRDGINSHSSDNDPGKWLYPPPQSFYATLFKILCGKDS